MSKASTSSSSWADAALAGLPPDDEAVQMAELAATAGRSLEVLFLVQCSVSEYFLKSWADVPVIIKACCLMFSLCLIVQGFTTDSHM